MEPQAERQAFAKARSYLNYHAAAKWLALVAAVGTGVLYVALLGVLWLFADLMVYRGNIPSFGDLSPARQQEFLTTWNGWDEADGEAMAADLQAVGVSPAAAKAWLQTDPERRAEQLSAEQKQRLWEAYVHHVLETRVGQAAAAVVWPAGENLDRGLDDRGILSLVVRNDRRPVVSAVTGWLAGWNPWTWQTRGLRPNFFYYLTGLLLVAFATALVRALLTYGMHEAAARASVAAATRLRRAVYHHTYRLGTLTIRALGPSEAGSLFTRHVEAVHDALYAWMTVMVREPVKFGLLLVFALVVNFWLALAFLACAVLVWLAGGQLAAYYRSRGRVAAHRGAEYLTLLRESLMLMRLVKVYLMELFNQARVERLLKRYANAQQARLRGEAVYRPLLSFLGTLAALLLLWVGGLIVLHEHLSVASAIVLATALISLYWPMDTWLRHRKVMRRGRESAAHVFAFLSRPGEVGQVVGAEFLPPLSRRLEFDNVTLREPGTNRVLLQDVSFSIQAGQRVALVGPEDLEKHALVYLIPRFLDPTSGEIRMDQHNLRWVTLDSLRAQIALVLQHNLVFHDTVANNIGCGDKAFSLPQIIEAAKVAHAHHFIQKLPRGYETPIGELGHPLGVSEQFRIALARAILRDPALFIIEEPAITLDDDVKALIDDTMTRILPGRTAIFLPHRLSTIKSCDQVLLLHRGRLEAAGDHRKLLADNALYRHLNYIEFSEMAEQV